MDDHLPADTARGTKTYYDTSGRVTKTERYSNVVIDLVTLPDGSQSTTLTTGTGLLSTSETFYDALGRVDHTISPSGLLTSYTYDKRGQQLSVTMTVATHNPDTGAVVNQTITSLSTYDDAGKVLTSTDPLNHTTQTVYDQYARPYKTIFADGSFVEMGYDSKGRKAWEREQRFANLTACQCPDPEALSRFQASPTKASRNRRGELGFARAQVLCSSSTQPSTRSG